LLDTKISGLFGMPETAIRMIGLAEDMPSLPDAVNA